MAIIVFRLVVILLDFLMQEYAWIDPFRQTIELHSPPSVGAELLATDSCFIPLPSMNASEFPMKRRKSGVWRMQL
jgi:hypothetical protein